MTIPNAEAIRRELTIERRILTHERERLMAQLERVQDDLTRNLDAYVRYCGTEDSDAPFEAHAASQDSAQ